MQEQKRTEAENCRRNEPENYHRTEMQKELIIKRLREKGCRITKQRLILLDIILSEECTCCKEIYYKAIKKDESIGTATVYRMVNTLEEIGAISRRSMYRIDCTGQGPEKKACTIELDDGTIIALSAHQWNQVVQSGLAACGYGSSRKVRRVAAVTN